MINCKSISISLWIVSRINLSHNRFSNIRWTNTWSHLIVITVVIFWISTIHPQWSFYTITTSIYTQHIAIDLEATELLISNEILIPPLCLTFLYHQSMTHILLYCFLNQKPSSILINSHLQINLQTYYHLIHYWLMINLWLSLLLLHYWMMMNLILNQQSSINAQWYTCTHRHISTNSTVSRITFNHTRSPSARWENVVLIKKIPLSPFTESLLFNSMIHLHYYYQYLHSTFRLILRCWTYYYLMKY